MTNKETRHEDCSISELDAGGHSGRRLGSVVCGISGALNRPGGYDTHRNQRYRNSTRGRRDGHVRERHVDGHYYFQYINWGNDGALLRMHRQKLRRCGMSGDEYWCAAVKLTLNERATWRAGLNLTETGCA